MATEDATKEITYAVTGPPLLLSQTKGITYVITGPDDGTRQTMEVRLVRGHH